MYEKKPETMDRQKLLKVYKEMKQIASRDALTGLYNRGELERKIKEKLGQMKKEDSCAFFIVDLDNFKEVNDRLGHLTGDYVLESMARLLSGIFGEKDIVGRLGGDEFVVFFWDGVTRDLVREKGQMICDQLQFSMGEDPKFVVTASAGIHFAAEKPEQGFEYLYRSADQALYRVKEGGKQGFFIQTDRDKQKKDKIKKSIPARAEGLQNILNYIDSGVALLDAEDSLSFLYASPAFAAMMGREQKEVQGANPLDFVYPDDRREMEEVFRIQIMENHKTINRMIRIVAKDGTLMWWRLYAKKVRYDEKKSVILAAVSDITNMDETAVFSKNRLFLDAMKQNMQRIWVVDIPSRTFRIIGAQEKSNLDIPMPAAFPQDLIEEGCIAEESAESFRNFAAGILEGRRQGSGNFKVRYRNREAYSWAAFFYHTFFDDKGRPLRAVGSGELIKSSDKDLAAAVESFSVTEGMKESLVLLFAGNLSRDSVYLLLDQGKKRSTPISFSSVLAEEKNKVALPEMNRYFMEYFSVEKLIEICTLKKRRWILHIHQRRDEKGEEYWAACVVNIYYLPKSRDIHMRVWVVRCELRHFWEKEMAHSIEWDPRSMLYTHSSVRAIAQRLMRDRKSSLCGLALVEISGITRLYYQDPLNKEKKWEGILTAMNLGAGLDCVAGQMGQNRFLLFFPEVFSQEDFKRRLWQILSFTKRAAADLTGENTMRFLFSGAVCPGGDPEKYDVMMKKAQALHSLWCNTTEDRVVFAEKEEDQSWKQLLWVGQYDQIRILREKDGRPLSEKEKNAAFTCMTGILSSESMKEVSRCVLKTLGEYYNADRVYILVPIEYGHILTMPHEWTSVEKTSIQHILSGILITNIPLIMRCKSEGRPVFLARENHDSSLTAKGKEAREMWHYAVFPVSWESRIQGYLCIENAEDPIVDGVFPEYLISCLLREREKYMDDLSIGRSLYKAAGMDLPNLGVYVEKIYAFNSDVYSSLGAVCLDVPWLSRINESHGFEYGRRLLLYVIDVLSDIFGRGMLFRTWDAEFVALCPNTSREVFQSKCTQLRTALSRRYPKQVRLGFSWSENVFRGKDLADEARILMRCDLSGMDKILFGETKNPVKSSGKKIINYMVVLQPKVHMITREVAGAEVFVRGVCEDGEILSPRYFLGNLKENGMIREMDLFVLDKAMGLLASWKEKGYRDIPLSVNFSWETLCHPSVMGSILAVQSRYPILEHKGLKIEVRQEDLENGGERLAKIMENFSQLGITFVADGAGAAKSSVSGLLAFPIKEIKLDPSLVCGILQKEESRFQVQEIVRFSKEKGKNCMAVGVESADQSVVLLQMGCTLAQGFYFEKPMLPEQFEQRYMISETKALPGTVM